jgi:hypothetical protein
LLLAASTISAAASNLLHQLVVASRAVLTLFGATMKHTYTPGHKNKQGSWVNMI